MSGNRSKPQPPSTTRSNKLNLSGAASNGGKPNVNLVSAQGEITSPQGSFPRRRPSAPSPTPNSNNKHAPSNPTDGSNLANHPLYPKIESLESDLRPFLKDDWETNQTYKLTKPKYYSILLHFDPETSARPSHKKDVLVSKFKKDLLPKLQPFRTSPPPANDTMETDDGSNEDYDPLSRRTTITMLANTIEKLNPHVKVSKFALKDEVLVLYKYYVNPNLQLPSSQFTKQPRAVSSKFVPNLSIQMIRHALQFYRPELFLNIPVLRLPNYISLY